jgi:hypothetical protein
MEESPAENFRSGEVLECYVVPYLGIPNYRISQNKDVRRRVFFDDGQGRWTPGKGNHSFLEDPMQKLHNDFVDKRKTEMLFPSIKNWVDTLNT